MPLKSCALTNTRASRGTRKAGGECLLTRVAAGDEPQGSRIIRYTSCSGCRTTVCCCCWEQVADVVEQHGTRIVFNPVWAALLARPWRVGGASTRAFQSRPSGGGTWVSQCPLCVEQRFEVPAPELPVTVPPYLWLPPQLVQTLRRTERCRVPLPDCTWSALQTHSCEILIYSQVVPDPDARRCFQRSPAAGLCAVHYAPPEPQPGCNGFNLRLIFGQPADGSQLVLLSAVAFGALAGCLATGGSPSVDTTAHLARAVVAAHVKRRVSDGQKPANLFSAPGGADRSLAESTYRVFRAGGAFGRLAYIGGSLDAARQRLGSTRCDARLPRAAGHFVAVAIHRAERQPSKRTQEESDEPVSELSNYLLERLVTVGINQQQLIDLTLVSAAEVQHHLDRAEEARAELERRAGGGSSSGES